MTRPATASPAQAMPRYKLVVRPRLLDVHFGHCTIPYDLFVDLLHIDEHLLSTFSTCYLFLFPHQYRTEQDLRHMFCKFNQTIK